MERLTITLGPGEIEFFSKLNFPNLEYLSVNDGLYLPEDEIIFCNLFKKCKEIYFRKFLFTEQLYKLTNLTKLSFTCFRMNHEDQLKSLDIIANHKQLEQIIIDEISFNVHNFGRNNAKKIFDRINHLKNTKPNAEISVSINFCGGYISYYYDEIDQYKQSFERAKWKAKLNDFIDYTVLLLKSSF